MAETYTLPEFAQALGKPILTIRRWIEADKLPAPYLVETQRALRVYSRGEVEVIVQVLRRNTESYAYFTAANQAAIQDMMQSIHAYRAHNV